MLSKRILAGVVVTLAAFTAGSIPGSVQAGITGSGMYFAGSSGNLSASADFELSGSTLTITLTNTSTADVLVPSDVLTGLFFNTSHLLTPLSASLNGSSVYQGSIAHNVGAGWQYKAFSSGLAQGKDAGISASGLGIFGPRGNFYHPSSGSNPNLEGIDYGLLSAWDNPLTGNGGITGHGPLIKDSIIFTLTAGSGFSLGDLGDTVVFQYGTSLTETHILAEDPPRPVPEPSSLILWGVGIVGTALWYRKRAA